MIEERSLPMAYADIERLREALRAADFTVDAVDALLGPVAAAAMGRADYLPALRATTGGSALETLIRLFLLGSVEPVPAVRAALGPLPQEAAETSGLVERDGDGIRAGLDLRPYGDDSGTWWVVSDLGSDVRPGPLRPDHVLGIGGASVTLARATVRPRVSTALDLGTGCGVQALHLSRHVDYVTATDCNRRALSLAAWTAALNGLSWELLEGDLYEPVAGRKFDLIVSNPPFVVQTPGQARYTYRDSGLGGDEVSRRLVAEAPRLLADGGWCQLLANWLHRPGEPWQARAGRWAADTGCDAWVLQREVLDPAEYVEMWLRDSGEQLRGEVAERWLEWFAAERVDGVGFGLVALHASGAADPVVRVEDAAPWPALPTGTAVAEWFDRQGWLRAAELLAARLVADRGLILEQTSSRSHDGWRVVGRELALDGRTEAVDEAAAALVAGCDGKTALTDLLAVLAVAYGVDPDRLTEAALPAVRRLVEIGILRPALR